MESFGAYLKALREEKGVSLEQIAGSTRIALSNLELLEVDRYDLLPPRVFVKGFIKSYVRQLDEDPEEALKRFEKFTSEGEVPDYDQEEHPVFHSRASRTASPASLVFNVVLTAVGVLALMILLLTGVSKVLQGDAKTQGTGSSTATDESAGDEVVGSERTTAPRTAQTAFEDQAGKKVLEIRATANTWLRVEPDMGPAEELTMAPGDVQIFTAKRGFVVQTGNAGGIRLRYDGRELPALGKRNQAVSLSVP
ncbi:MAG: RodZ domain-containing protein [Pseudomonadota bacterium]